MPGTDAFAPPGGGVSRRPGCAAAYARGAAMVPCLPSGRMPDASFRRTPDYARGPR